MTAVDVPSPEFSLNGDAHGQAALVLVESLIHGMVHRGLITTLDAVSLLEGASQAQTDIADDSPAAHSPRLAIELIARIIASLKTDLAE